MTQSLLLVVLSACAGLAGDVDDATARSGSSVLRQVSSVRAQLSDGSKVSGSVVVTNATRRRVARAWASVVWRPLPAGASVRIGRFRVSALARRASRKIAFRVPVPPGSSPGRYRLSVCVAHANGRTVKGVRGRCSGAATVRVPAGSGPPSPLPPPAPPPAGPPSVRFVYVAPPDRPHRRDYAVAIQSAAIDLRAWVRAQLGDRTFRFFTSRIVELCSLPRTNDYYASETWDRVLTDVQSCVPVAYFSRQYSWVLYVDVNRGCKTPGPLGRGGSGLTMLGRQDIEGLAAAPVVDDCAMPYTDPVSRYIGGLGHELGHALGLNHPPGCDEQLPTCDYGALMWSGLYGYPNTYLRPDDKQILLASPFIQPAPAG